MKEKEDKGEFYSNLKDLARDTTNLTFQLLRDRVLRFKIERALKINTFLLNYFLIQNYFLAFDLQDDLIKGKKLIGDEGVETSFFRKYAERLHGIFILVPMKYQVENEFTTYQTDKVINQMDAYGEFVNRFFSSHENMTSVTIDTILDSLKDYVISIRFLPDLGFDPEFNQIFNSKAITQLFYITYPKEYFQEYDIQRFAYPLEDSLANEYWEAMKDSDKKLFSFNPELKDYQDFLINAANYFVVPDFGSKVLMKEVIEKFKTYYTLRVSSRKKEIKLFLDCFEILFRLTEGKLYKKIPGGLFNNKIESVENNGEFLNKFCFNKTFLPFPKTLDDFKPYEFISEYYEFLRYGCYRYMGSVYTGAILIWRAMIKYFEDLQSTKEFKDTKGSLLENWCLAEVIKRGFTAEKLILRNSDLEPSKNYYNMKENIKPFNREVLEFEVKFIEHQKPYSFHEIDLVFRFEDTLFVIECKGRSFRLSSTEKFFKWAKNFKDVYDLLKKKVENLAFCVENNNISHPLFDNVKEFIPIVIQTEGVFQEFQGFTTEVFENFLDYLKGL